MQKSITDIFKDIINDIENNTFYDENEVRAMRHGLEKFEQEYISSYGESFMNYADFMRNIEEINQVWWDENLPFGLFSYAENEEFFKNHCL